ncbi:hypothetical protein [Rhizobium sp. 9140]|uniref:hypothetical protein n=1 Tax=Rhizobium sp. 9140 TaxID=1761900 RepID=UPI001112A85F|nr:hypothetical protein [Rhizobium sp. 9140]
MLEKIVEGGESTYLPIKLALDTKTANLELKLVRPTKSWIMLELAQRGVKIDDIACNDEAASRDIIVCNYIGTKVEKTRYDDVLYGGTVSFNMKVNKKLNIERSQKDWVIVRK